MADEDRESPAGMVVMAFVLAMEVGGARGHTSLTLFPKPGNAMVYVRM